MSVASPAASQTPPNYTVDDLGPLPFIADDITVGLNQSGHVAAWKSTSGLSVSTCEYDGHSWRPITLPSQYPNSISHAMNDKDEIVGWANTSTNPVDSLSTTRAFVWQDGNARLLGTLGGRDSSALGVNDKGEVVGVSLCKNQQRHAFLYSRKKMIDLGTLPTGVFSQAYGINNVGDIVGVASVGQSAKHAVFWSHGRISDLGTLPKALDSDALAINDRGLVVGYSDSPDGYHATTWSGGEIKDLGTLGDTPSLACGVNNSGQVVGMSATKSFYGLKHHAFVWQAGQMFDLNQCAQGSGWNLIQAFSINDGGQIVCVGRGKDEEDHILLLTPSHP